MKDVTRQTTGIQILFGSDGIKQAYHISLTCKTMDVICLTDNYYSIIGEYFDKVYAPALYSTNYRTREILPDTAENRKSAQAKSHGHEVRFLKNAEKSESDYILSEDKIILISYNTEAPIAIIITDPEMVKSFNNQFEALWKCLK